MITYLIKVSVALLLFPGVYHLFLRKETNFILLRFYLVSALLTALVIPVVNAHHLGSLFIEDAEVVYEYWLPDLTISPVNNNALGSLALTWNLIISIYFLGVTVSLFRFIISIYGLKRTLRLSKMRRDNAGWYYVLDGDKGSFSFFNYILIGSKASHTEEDKQTILAHERAHARQWHSIDVMLVQLTIILVWFNPIIYWYRKTLEQLHEFEADAIASENRRENYCGLLVRDTLDSAQFSIANHFNKSLTLKRIAMINALKNKMPFTKKMGLALSVALIVVLIACEEKVLNDMKRAAGQSVLLTEYPAEVQKAVNEIKQKNPGANPTVYGVVKTQDLESIDLAGKTATMFFRDNDPDYKVYVILGIDDIKMAASSTVETKGGKQIYTIVQQPPQPVGGMAQFYKFVSENLRYPEQARRMGVEGRVFLKFLVDDHGNLSELQIIRGIGAGCDEEAKRVVSSSPTWNPGMQDGSPVNAYFNLAIIFKLDEGKKGE